MKDKEPAPAIEASLEVPNQETCTLEPPNEKHVEPDVDLTETRVDERLSLSETNVFNLLQTSDQKRQNV
jgi:hypothetical protein